MNGLVTAAEPIVEGDGGTRVCCKSRATDGGDELATLVLRVPDPGGTAEP